MSRRKQLLEVQQKEVPPFVDYFAFVGPLITTKELAALIRKSEGKAEDQASLETSSENENNNGNSIAIPQKNSEEKGLKEILLLQSEREFKKGEDVSEVPLRCRNISRYPEEDTGKTGLPQNLHIFCFPLGCFISREKKPIQSHTFALTQVDGSKIYACALTVYEKLPSTLIKKGALEYDPSLSANPKHKNAAKQMIPFQKLLRSSREIKRASVKLSTSNSSAPGTPNITEDEDNKRSSKRASKRVSKNKVKLYVPRSLVILSRWAFSAEFAQFLQELYRIALEGSSIPVERIIANFCSEVPVPPRGRVRVEYRFFGDVDSKRLSITRPSPNSFPDCNNLQEMFDTLGVTHVLELWTSILLETKVILHSTNLGLLGSVANGITSLMFPLQYCHFYCPLLPTSLLDYIQAPLPFFVGVHTKALSEILVPKDILIVDLDNNTFKYPELDNSNGGFVLVSSADDPSSTKSPLMQFPERAKIEKKLKKLTDKQQGFDHHGVRLVFIHALIKMIGNYKDYVVENASELKKGEPVFKYDEFLKSVTSAKRPFLAKILESQSFHSFIEYRTLYSIQTPTTVFFDEMCIQYTNMKNKRRSINILSKKKKEDTPFLDSDFGVNKTVFVLPPDDADIPQDNPGPYKYPRFPVLDRSLFPRSPRSFESLVNAVSDFNPAPTMSTSSLQLVQQLETNLVFHRMSRAFDKWTNRKSRGFDSGNNSGANSPLSMSPSQNHSNSAAEYSKFQVEIANKRKEEEMRRKIKRATIVQTLIRRWLARRRYLAMRQTLIRFEALLRMHLVRERYIKEKRAAIAVQSTWRMYSSKRAYKKTKQKIILLQSLIRRHLAVKKFKALVQESIESKLKRIFEIWMSKVEPLHSRSRQWQELSHSVREDPPLLALSNLRISLDKFELVPAGSRNKKSKQLSTERKDLYQLLRHLPDTRKVYTQYQIDPQGKKKKYQLVFTKLWNAQYSREKCDQDTWVVLTLHKLREDYAIPSKRCA